jgi:hypothetical protein
VSQHGDVTDESNMVIKTTQNKSKKVWCPFLHIIDSWVVNDTMFWSWMVKPNQD